jgi:hypothetical protein
VGLIYEPNTTPIEYPKKAIGEKDDRVEQSTAIQAGESCRHAGCA